MRFALSTNWNNLRHADGAAVADEALALGFDALELGYATPPEQIAGIKTRLDQIAVDSVHAYCPVPIGAPSGHPEIYQLADPHEDLRALARLYLTKSFACAAEVGAKVVVFHAGYVNSQSYWNHFLHGPQRIGEPTAADRRRRAKRGRRTMDVLKAEFEKLVPALEKHGLALALENLPRFEGFPSTEEAETLMKELAGAPIALWFDTGHARVRECRQWDAPAAEVATRLATWVRGMHLNDVKDIHDDHFAPGKGNVDFASLKPLAQREGLLHVVEPHSEVTAADLRAGLALLRRIWEDGKLKSEKKTEE